MIYRSFDFYTKLSKGDIGLATQIESIVLESLREYRDSLTESLSIEAQNELDGMVAVGLRRAAVISSIYTLTKL